MAKKKATKKKTAKKAVPPVKKCPDECLSLTKDMLEKRLVWACRHARADAVERLLRDIQVESGRLFADGNDQEALAWRECAERFFRWENRERSAAEMARVGYEDQFVEKDLDRLLGIGQRIDAKAIAREILES